MNAANQSAMHVAPALPSHFERGDASPSFFHKVGALFRKNKNKGHIKVAVEYIAPHWVVLIQNPGQKKWAALRDREKLLELKNLLGDTVKSVQAIQTFTTQAEAMKWRTENLPESVLVARTHSEIEKFLIVANQPIPYNA